MWVTKKQIARLNRRASLFGWESIPHEVLQCIPDDGGAYITEWNPDSVPVHIWLRGVGVLGVTREDLEELIKEQLGADFVMLDSDAGERLGFGDTPVIAALAFSPQAKAQLEMLGLDLHGENSGD